MKLQQLLHGVITKSDLPDLEVAALTSDSRKVEPGFVFVAVPGVKVDGHDFIEQAQQAGAVAIVMGRRSRGSEVLYCRHRHAKRGAAG